MDDELLKDLLHNTPSGRLKLLAAWDGLSVETQVKLLHSLTQDTSLHPDIVAKALSSPNEYVRYLAARAYYPPASDEASRSITERIDADQSNLVKYAKEETELFGFELNPEHFWGSPKDKRLAMVRGPHRKLSTIVRHRLVAFTVAPRRSSAPGWAG